MATATRQLDALPRSVVRRPATRTAIIIAITVTLASVLEILDTSIVNVAIPHMMGTSARRSTRSPGCRPATSSRT